MSDRTFTLAEATELLPVLESLLRRAMSAKQNVEQIDSEFRALSNNIHQAGGIALDVKKWAFRRAEREKTLQQIKDSLAEISAAGVQVKDLDIGLLDFPFVLEDKVVLLCWKLGEPAITHWHGTQEGFAGRKPVDARFARGNA
ncbi:MAG TPA: DUF2203 domain-containing protein [Terriglobales bacterium]|nr:DUF2203 domain-containing protein [Terriglobales bacterium]